MTFKQIVLDYIKDGKLNNKSERSIIKALNLQSLSDKLILADTLKQLVKEESIALIDGKYLPFEQAGYIKGKLQCHEKGFAFLLPEDKNLSDLFIAKRNLNGALQGDVVYCTIIPKSGGNSDEAQVVKIISRGICRLTGDYYNGKGFGFVVPDDKGYSCDIYIPKGKNKNACQGDKVVCNITKFPFEKNPEGVVTQILGKSNDFNTKINSILINNDAPQDFPQDVIAKADSFADQISKQDIVGRKDLRNLLTVTIDGESARDFDDAISVIKNEEGYTLYVHIADVSNYVNSGDCIDKQAFERGTSIYLPEKVIPMLPVQLSNGLCSLNPNVDRLTLTVEITYDDNGNVLNRDFYTSVINSNKRLTYNQVQQLFDNPNCNVIGDKNIEDMLFNANRLKEILLSVREQKGSVDLNISESEIYFENGKLFVDSRKNLQSERLIEQFMISANVAVAEYIYYMNIPFIYRIHEKPEMEKVNSFRQFLNCLGVTVKWKEDDCFPKDYQMLLKKLENTNIFNMVNNVMLRSMKKAVYSSENKGHFGLNEGCYCHFTSPIRRYPDLMVHRILKAVFDGRIGEIIDLYGNLIEDIAKECSKKEQQADVIERSVDDAYVCKFMSQFLGDYFEGIISGVTANGIYVQLENSVEGFVKVEDLPKSDYNFDQQTYSLVGKKHKFTLGQKVVVKLISANYENSKINFVLAK